LTVFVLPLDNGCDLVIVFRVKSGLPFVTAVYSYNECLWIYCQPYLKHCISLRERWEKTTPPEGQLTVFVTMKGKNLMCALSYAYSFLVSLSLCTSALKASWLDLFSSNVLVIQ